MFGAGGLDVLKIGKVTSYDPIRIENGFEFRVCASDVGGDLPVWMGLLEGSRVGSCLGYECDL
jgi:hypothetical protein